MLPSAATGSHASLPLNPSSAAMKTYSLIRRQTLATDMQTAWRFFSNPANLRLITPPWLDFRITSRLPESIYAGLIITYRIRPIAGIAVPWVSEITHVDAPRFFVDDQRQGPYRFWHHQHHLRAVAGGIEKIDEVHYRLPAGLLGLGLHALTIKNRLDTIFQYRYHALERLFPIDNRYEKNKGATQGN
jgi:ligand-binding SRPBCC domain-containing protein